MRFFLVLVLLISCKREEKLCTVDLSFEKGGRWTSVINVKSNSELFIDLKCNIDYSTLPDPADEVRKTYLVVKLKEYQGLETVNDTIDVLNIENAKFMKEFGEGWKKMRSNFTMIDTINIEDGGYYFIEFELINTDSKTRTNLFEINVVNRS